MRNVRTLAPLLFCSFVLAAAASADPINVRRDDHPSALSARGIATADFNRDGWLDIATAHNDPDGVTILLNRGKAGGYTQRFFTLLSGPFDIAAGDINKDGNPDLAIANADSNAIAIWYGDGNGAFLPFSMALAGLANPRGVALADINRDGNLDIVFTQYTAGVVSVAFNDGAGTFTLQPSRYISMPVGTNPQGVAVADFDLNGWADIAVANNTSGGITILNAAPGGTSFTRRNLDVPQQQNVITTGDFDKDGRPDVAAASTGSSDVTVWLNGRNATTVLVYPSGGGSPRGIVAIDLNRDGALDIATANRGTSTVQVLSNRGDGKFDAAVGYAAGTGSRTVAAGDFNHDGRIDLATGNEYTQSVTVLSNTTAFPRAAFAFDRKVLGTANNGFSDPPADAADFDRDGRLDAVTTGSGILVYLANGRTVQLPSTTEDAIDLAAADSNRDGFPDVVAILGPFEGPSRIEAYLNDGTARFSTRQVTQTSIRVFSMKIADFNRDRLPDVLLLGLENNAPVFQLFLAAGDGTYRLASSKALTTAQFIGIGDVNRDGATDLITSVSHTSSATVITLLNDGAGHFTEAGAIEVPGFQSVWEPAVGDLNHDGYGDFAGTGPLANFTGDNQMFVLLGGPSGFSPPLYLHSREFALAAAIVDLDADGNPDVLGDTGILFRGHGDGTFEPAELFDFYAPHPRIVDFNGDGLLDIVSAEQVSNVQVILNRRGDTNHPPTVTLGPDMTYEYTGQFSEERSEFFARGTDPDMHKLTFRWTYPDGHVVDTGTFPFLTVPVMNPGRYEFMVEASDGRGATATDTVVITVTPSKEIVIYPGAQTGDTFPHGNWTIAGDPTAAVGRVARDVNAGAPKITIPSANPANYVDIFFAADPTQTYKLWVRLKADGDNAANDSAWLQFSNAVDASGRTFAPGTTSGIEVVLEECSGCGDEKWGWRDEAWGRRDLIGSLTLRFPKGGSMLRLQTREDGVSIDQIVLSAEKYLTTRPGTVKNDTTIVPKRF